MTCMAEGCGAYKVPLGRPEGMTTWNNIGVNEGIILQWIFMKKDREARTELFWLRIGTGGGRLSNCHLISLQH